EKSRKRFPWIIKIFNTLKDKDINIRLHLFGTLDKPANIEHSSYVKNPSPEQLLRFYNKVDFWLAPTMSEGLHIPPQEAMLCGCVLFGADEELSGMSDYLEDGKTGFIIKNCKDAAEKVADMVSSEDGRVLLEQASKKGSKKIVSLGDRKANMERMIGLFKGSRSQKTPGDYVDNMRALIAKGRMRR
ncbi:unnamed protein product, partial [marine sediment metagenome]